MYSPNARSGTKKSNPVVGSAGMAVSTSSVLKQPLNATEAINPMSDQNNLLIDNCWGMIEEGASQPDLMSMVNAMFTTA